jgi:hypothetical protein
MQSGLMFSIFTLQNFKDSAEFAPLGRIEEIKQDLKYPLTPAKWTAEVLLSLREKQNSD